MSTQSQSRRHLTGADTKSLVCLCLNINILVRWWRGGSESKRESVTEKQRVCESAARLLQLSLSCYRLKLPLISTPHPALSLPLSLRLLCVICPSSSLLLILFAAAYLPLTSLDYHHIVQHGSLAKVYMLKRKLRGCACEYGMTDVHVCIEKMIP